MSKVENKDLIKFLRPFTADIKATYTNSLEKVKDQRQLKQGLTIVKSISKKKRMTKSNMVRKATKKKQLNVRQRERSELKE